MEDSEYIAKIKAIDAEAQEKKNAIAKIYAHSQNPVKIGDLIEDHVGRIKVEKIGISSGMSSNLPLCVYYGIEITKAGTPSKKGTKRWIYQSNLKEV
jgi:hypothetical protein